MPQRWHAAVVEVRSSGPDAIQRRSHIAARLPDIGLFAVLGKPALTISIAMRRRQRVQPHAVRADLFNRHRPLGIAAAGPICPMALGTNPVERRSSLLSQLRVDVKRISRRLNG